MRPLNSRNKQAGPHGKWASGGRESPVSPVSPRFQAESATWLWKRDSGLKSRNSGLTPTARHAHTNRSQPHSLIKKEPVPATARAKTEIVVSPRCSRWPARDAVSPFGTDRANGPLFGGSTNGRALGPDDQTATTSQAFCLGYANGWAVGPEKFDTAARMPNSGPCRGNAVKDFLPGKCGVFRS